MTRSGSALRLYARYSDRRNDVLTVLVGPSPTAGQPVGVPGSLPIRLVEAMPASFHAMGPERSLRSGLVADHTQGASTMNIRRLPGRNLDRIQVIASIILLLTLISSIPPPTLSRAHANREQPLDLAAMALTPADLDKEGMSGYEALASGAAGSEVAIAFQIGNWRDESGGVDYVAEQLEDAGLSRSYAFGLSLPDPADPRFASRGIYASVNEFEDDEDAAEAFSVIVEMSEEGTSVESVDGDVRIGDEALLVRDIAAHDLVLAFRADRVVAFLKLKSYDDPGPTVTEIEVLAELLHDRIEAGLGGDAPGLANQALHLADDNYQAPFEVRLDQYVRLDEEDTSLDWESAGEQERRRDVAAGAVDVYAFSQFLQLGDANAANLPTQLSWEVDLYRFADDETASAWLKDRSDRIETGFPTADGAYVKQFEVLRDAPEIGDESFAVAYVEAGARDCGCTIQITRIHLRLGSVVADVALGTLDEGGIAVGSAVAIAETQAACLASSACLEPVPLSAALSGQSHSQLKWDVA